jgi:hypothetical protein
MRLSPVSLFLLSTLAAIAAPAAKPFAFGSVRFEANRGQTDASVLYLARAPGQRVFLTERGVVFRSATGAAVTMQFEGSGDSRWEPAGAPVDSISYYIGSDQRKWVVDAPRFDRVVRRNAWPGIDIEFHGDGNRLEYDLILAPGADASKARIRFERPASAKLQQDGSVEIAAAGDTLRQHPPEIWQTTAGGERRNLKGKFVPDGGDGLRLSLASHDLSMPVVVDPVLEFASYLGGENDDEVVAIVDGAVAGNTRSVAFPGTSPAQRSSRDVFIYGTGPVVPGQITQSTLSRCIIIGGSGDDQLGGIARDTFLGGYYLAGTTTSNDFPVPGGTIAGGSLKYHGGASDGFVAFIQVQQSFSSLGFANYVGGSGADRINSVSFAGLDVAYAGITDSPDLPAQNAPQTSLSGGKDAFYGVFSQYGATGPSILGYLGGSGDDTANAVAFRNATDLWIGGSTASTDFPFANGALSGPSDAFLAVVKFSPSISNAAATASLTAYRIGGSGDDSINALVATPYSSPVNFGASYIYLAQAVDGIGFAGTTTSPDLPVLNAAQPQLGGASDGFAGIWDRVSAAPRWMTYAGGSGADQFNAIAQNWAGDLYVGGSTSSADLPVVNALQPVSGGGQDGMFAVYDYAGALQQLTYFGGSGDDKIAGMWMDYNYIARMVGSTSSTNLPQRQASQGPGGGLDGFVANVGSDYLIGSTNMILPKDGLLTFSLRSAHTAFRQPVTYQSTDPSRVRLVYLGQSFDQVTAAADDNIQVEALSDSGSVDITASSPGYASKTIHVNLYPGAFATTYGIPIPASLTASGLNLSTWTSAVTLYQEYCAIDPASGAILGFCMGLRSGVPVPAVHWSSSDPTVFQIASPYGVPEILAAGPGAATLIFSVDGYNVIQPNQTVNVAAPAPAQPANGFSLGKDLTAKLPLGFSLNGVNVSSGYRGTLTVRSSDPGRLLLALDANTPGSDHLTVTMSGGAPTIYAQALADSGTVQVALTSDQFAGEVDINVNLEPTVLKWGVGAATGPGFASSIALTAGSLVTTLQYSLQGVSGGIGSIRPGAPPLTLTLANTNPNVVELNRLTLVAGSSNSYTLHPLAAGASTLTLTGSNPNVPVIPASLPVAVAAALPTVNLPSLPASLNVGNGLEAEFSFGYTTGSYPGGPSQTLIVSVDDPSVATLSLSATTAGTNQVTLQAGLANTNYTVYVQGHGASGTTNLHVQFPAGSKTIAVRLFPSGAGFSRSFSTSIVQGFSLEAEVIAFYLDPSTGIGLVAQTPAPGPGLTVDFSADGPVQFQHQSAVLTAANPTAKVDITAPPAGHPVNVTVTTEGGAAVSPITATEKAGTLAPTDPIVLTTMTLAQGELQQYTFGNGLTPATVTSSDPANVLLSASASDPGAASIQLPAGATSIYLRALGSSGAFTVEFDQPGVPVPYLIQVALVPLQLKIAIPYPGSVSVGSTISYQASLGAQTLAPGIGPFHFTVRSADTTIATVTPAEFDLGGNSTFPGALTVTGVSAGATSLIVTPPSGIYSAYPPSVTVGGPAPAVPPAYTIGVNLQGALTIDLGSNFSNPNGAIVTFTSSDPTVLLLSRSATTAGTASVVVAVPAGSRFAQPIYLQALAQGTATIQLTAGAPAQVAANVSVKPSWVSCGSTPISLAVNATQTLYCSALYANSQTAASAFQSLGPRAGLSNLTLGVTSSASNVFTVTPAALTLGASTSVTLRGIAAGTGTLQIAAPPGFGSSPDGSEAVPVTVTPPVLSLGCGPEMVMGQDTQFTCAIYSTPGAVTATSGDPSLLVVSANANTAGAATATATPSGGNLSLTLQALANAGTVEVVIHADGYQDARVAVALRPSQFAIQSPFSGLQQTLSMQTGNSFPLTVGMFENGTSVTPRAGLTVPLDLTVDNPNVASLTPAHLNFTGAQGSGNFSVKALAPGSTLLRLSAPANYQVTGSPLPISVSQ